jgi:DNA-binding beta-propeller fold protein YncE
MLKRLSVLFVAALLGTTSAAWATPAGYSSPKTIKVGGDGGWDYATLDATGKLLYLPRTTHTQVVETATGKVVGDIPGNKGSHGVVLVPEVGRGFITNGEGANVQVFDLKTNKPLGTIAAADDADGAIFDPASKMVLVMCGDAGELLAIDPKLDLKTGKADPALKLGGKPEFAAVDGLGHAYVNLVDKNQVAVVDTLTLKVTALWPTGTGTGPTGMAIDPVSRRLFVGCHNQKMIVMSADNGRVLATLPIGKGVDATAFDGRSALASCGDGTLTVIAQNAGGRYVVTQSVKTAPRARTMALDAKTRTVYLPTADVIPGKPRPKPVPGTFKLIVIKQSSR